MDKTKKYTIIFLVICFIGIGVAGLFHQTPSSTSTPQKETTSTVTQDTQQETEDTESEGEKKTESKTDNKTVQKEEKKTTESSKQTTKKTTEKASQETKTETTSETKKETQKEASNSSQTTNSQEKEETPKSQATVSIQDLNGIVASETMTITEGDTAYSVLKTLCNQKGISLSTKGYGKIIYVKEINGLSEFDYGNMSGWKYKVNGVYPNVGAGAYTLKDGDRVEWVYTTEG